ncbi:hypothetical protein CPC08DRAFT_727230 [Agrocybe pediades]|nr:hypothetical protein CPC08DRAFT_727230 [Agrocybe pediades]
MSTIQSYPYDVLSLIFLSSLPNDPLAEPPFPSALLTTFSPLKLCHVCAHWRSVALSTPALWKELNFQTRLEKLSGRGSDDATKRSEAAVAGGREEKDGTMVVIAEKDLAFLAFWHRNVSNHVPSLRVGIHPRGLGSLGYVVVDLGFGLEDCSTLICAADDEDQGKYAEGCKGQGRTERTKGTHALFDLIQRAEYLDLDHHFSTALRAFCSSSPSCPSLRHSNLIDADASSSHSTVQDAQKIYAPNLRTLLMRQGHERPHRYMFREIPFAELDHSLYDSTHSLYPFTSKTKVQKLFLEETSILSLNPATRDGLNYAHITHMHTTSLHLTLDTWFLLIRSMPSLYAGTFELIITSDLDVYTHPSPAVLPKLKYLSITTYGSMVNTSVLLELSLPELIALRVDIFPWLTVRKLHALLQSTPNLRELQLGPDHPWCDVSMGMAIPSPSIIPSTGSHNNLPSAPSPNGSPTLPNSILNPQITTAAVTPLWHIVPYLQYIHFSGSECRSPTGAFASQTSERGGIVRAVLYSPWLDLRRPDNQIRRIEFGAGRTNGWRHLLQELIDEVVEECQEGIGGLELRVRPEGAVELWGKRNSSSSVIGIGGGGRECGSRRLGDWFEDDMLGFSV